MVFLSRCFMVRSRFLDNMRVYVKGGRGGKGVEKYGGYGGRGGHVYMEGDEKITLKSLRDKHPEKRFLAPVGKNSSIKCLQGSPGTDIVIKVPVGVTIKTDEERIVGDINEHGVRVLVAKGGVGGSPDNRYIGQKGVAMSVRLDLKLIADIGLVGFPNAGKSTLLSAVSRATPKIASYPFTTLHPQIGTITFPDLRSITMADLPGLIEGAHYNIGLGHRFLKHIERTQLLVFVVDVQGFQLKDGYPVRSPYDTVMLLNKELELYRPELVTRPALLVINKLDTDDAERKADEMCRLLQDRDANPTNLADNLWPKRMVEFSNIMRISAAECEGTEELKNLLRAILDDIDDEIRSNDDKDMVVFEREMKTKMTEHHKGHRHV